jgi:hypothetical protein
MSGETLPLNAARGFTDALAARAAKMLREEGYVATAVGTIVTSEVPQERIIIALWEATMLLPAQERAELLADVEAATSQKMASKNGQQTKNADGGASA